MTKLTPKQQEWLINNNKTYPIKCKICDFFVKWQAGKGQYGIYCSRICANIDPDRSLKRKQTNLEKYGVENPQQNTEIKEKTKNTKH